MFVETAARGDRGGDLLMAGSFKIHGAGKKGMWFVFHFLGTYLV